MTKNQVFKFLIEYLEKKRIPYALLGATDNYPNVAGDIDLVISKEAFTNIDNTVREFCAQHNLLLTQKLQHESTGCMYVLAFYNAVEDSFVYLEFDFCSDYKRWGRLYITAGKLLANRTFNEDKNYWVLNDTYSFLYYLIKKVDKGNIDSVQFDQLLECWKNDKENILQEIQTYLSSSVIAKLSEAFQFANLDLLQKSLAEIRKDLHTQVRKRLGDMVLDKLRLLKRAAAPTGLMVCMLGRDGSGKSTFGDKLMESINVYFRESEKYHLYPGLIFKYQNKQKNFSEPHAQIARSRLFSFLKLNLLFLEFFCGYWLKIYPKKITSTFLLFDRYFIDVLVDPVRYRNSSNNLTIKFFHALIPKPDVWIILDLNSEVLLQRKNELTYEKSESLRARYLKMQEYLPNSIVINTENELHQCVNEATAVVLQKMNDKILKK